VIVNLKSIKELHIGYNPVETFPDFLRELPELQVLDVSWWRIDRLPEYLCELPKLRTINMRQTDVEIPPGLSSKVMHSFF
jgi:Leucine-rich repeat (LRR) protein